MTPETAFKQFETTVNADPARLKEARLRRDAFVDAFKDEPDIVDAFAIGSLARKTQMAPLHDVDILVTYDGQLVTNPPPHFVGWAGSVALRETAHHIMRMLGPRGIRLDLLNRDGGSALHVRETFIKRHAVECAFSLDGRGAFTVDVVPAVHHPAGGVLIPERGVDGGPACWIRSDPVYLIDCAKQFQTEWNYWVPVVRTLKYWNNLRGAGMSSLYVEVLAHTELPRHGPRSLAIASFFRRAQRSVSRSLEDPAGLSGKIQPDLDVDRARRCLASAAELAHQAAMAEVGGRDNDAVCAWHYLFGAEFPVPLVGCRGPVAAPDDGASIIATALASLPSPRRPGTQNPSNASILAEFMKDWNPKTR